MKRRNATGRIAMPVVVGLLLLSPAAQANVAATMQSELQEAGIPVISVAVVTPPPATAEDLAAFEADPVPDYPSITRENLISPNPASPLPVARVVFGKSTVTPLPGIIQAPGFVGYLALEDADMPVWRLTIMSALKHRLGNGDVLAGLSMQPQFPHIPNPGQPDLYITPPNADQFPPGPRPQTLGLQDIEGQVEEALPAWARTATVNAANIAGGERRVTIEFEMPADAMVIADPREVAGRAGFKQLQLNENGANIGSIVVRASDPATQLPLFVYAGDASWGQHYAWVSPVAEPYISRAMPMPVRNPLADVDETDVGETIEKFKARAEGSGLPPIGP